MSVTVISAVWKESNSTGSQRLVLLALADSAHDSGELSAYARSQTYLATKTRLSKRSVKRAIDELVGMGELEIINTGSGRASSDYRVVLPSIEGCQIVTPGVTPRQPRGVRVTAQGCQGDTPIIPSLPSKNPSPPARRVGLRLDPEKFTLDDVVAIWPRPGEVANRIEKEWKRIRKFVSLMDLAIAISAYAEVWDGASEDQLRYALSINSWLDQKRWKEGQDQQGPREKPQEGASAAPEPNGPPHPGDLISTEYPSHDAFLAAQDEADRVWTEHYGESAWPSRR